MNVKGWAITAGLSAVAGAVAILMMPHNNPTRKLAAKAANKMEDVAWKVSDTISNNIAFGVDGVSEDRIEEVARLADVHGNIAEFKEGYQTVLGERGVTVSGGQKQRISIARALLKEAPILILDDSVSAVDTKTEKSILENLRRTREGRTTILIAHRISTIERMDKIIFRGRLFCRNAGLFVHQQPAVQQNCRY